MTFMLKMTLGCLLSYYVFRIHICNKIPISVDIGK
jgi:hypothetical protein